MTQPTWNWAYQRGYEQGAAAVERKLAVFVCVVIAVVCLAVGVVG